MSVRTESSERWVRGFLEKVAVVDTRRPVLFWEDHFPVPHYAFQPQDVRTDLLLPAAGEAPREPWFALPHGPVTQWFDVQAEGRTLPHAAWVRDAPELADLLVFSWQDGLMDRWLEEDEEVSGHPRDPHARVDALPSSRHVVVSLNGVVLADSCRPVLLFETGLPVRYYLPREDVDLGALTATSNRSHCPYKGSADQYWDVIGEQSVPNLAWSYSDPFPAVGRITGLVAFYNEFVDIAVDGVAQERPVTPFSSTPHAS